MKVQETLLCPVGDRWDTRVYTEERLVAAKGEKKRRKTFKKKRKKKGGVKGTKRETKGARRRRREKKKEKEKGAMLGRRFEGYTGYPGRWAPRYNTRLPLLAAISVNCSVPDKKNVGKIKFSSVIHHEATDAGRAGSIRIGWLRPKTFT